MYFINSFLARLSKIWATFLLINISLFSTTFAQYITPYQPSRDEVLDSYKEAGTLDSLARNSVYKTNVDAHWQEDNKGFWYKNNLANGDSDFFYVNALTGVKQKAFDSAKLTESLNKLIGSQLAEGKLSIKNIKYD